MDNEQKKRLERKFDRELTDGEAAEIANAPILHRDADEFYEETDDAGIPLPIFPFDNDGR
jgi:hypothetical protein